MILVKEFTDPVDHGVRLEHLINGWAKAGNHVVLGVDRHLGGCFVRYEAGLEPEKAVAEPAAPAGKTRLPTRMPPTGSAVPTVIGEAETDDTVGDIHVMAGVFFRPEGDRFGADDKEPAPPPLFSPGLDLQMCADLFRNIPLPGNGAADAVKEVVGGPR
jgi:hypothetical protein